MRSFPVFRQLDRMDCGPTCLRMITKFYGKNYSIQSLREKCQINREGVSLLNLSQAAETIGFHTLKVKINFAQLVEEMPLPCILHWEQNHFVVLYKIRKKRLTPNLYEMVVGDPALGIVQYSQEKFLEGWAPLGQGISLAIEPNPDFHQEEEDIKPHSGFGRLIAHLKQYKKMLTQLLVGLLVGSLLQLLFPVLSQSIIDIGINTQNPHFIYVILGAQLMLMIGKFIVELVRSWVVLYVSTRLNISVLSDFLIKLLRLAPSFFDSKVLSDLLQRIHDQQRIETFLTNTTLNTLFSLFNIVLFCGLLAFYNSLIFGVFLFGNVIYFAWVSQFFRKRQILDIKKFNAQTQTQSAYIELIQGINDIKIANADTLKRWEWEGIQSKLFRLNVKGLIISQYQLIGGGIINESKNILITFLSATAVLKGELTLGTMLAIQYIIGQLNSPIEHFIVFFQMMQDARMSLERLEEIHHLPNEEGLSQSKLHTIPVDQGIHLDKVSFHYQGNSHQTILKNVTLHIQPGKTTAIVGKSGSGKTTLLKLLLQMYQPTSGAIHIGENWLTHISPAFWRSQCGTVLQDGFILSDTFIRNIALGDEYPDMEKLYRASKLANIHPFIETLPMGYHTKIGMDGHGLSQGQKQRILIARAIYKDPTYLFLDEATNALDSDNENAIMQNLETYFQGRTRIIVAHRLSTVRNADHIIVLEKGVIIEQGNHEQLTHLGGNYYRLVKNQLELGA